MYFLFSGDTIAYMHTHGPGWTVISTKAPANIGYHALGPAVAFTSLAVITFLLRWYTRAFIVRKIEWEDFYISAAMIMSLGITGIVGEGKHVVYAGITTY